MPRRDPTRCRADPHQRGEGHRNAGILEAAATITVLAKILISSHDDEPNTLYHWNKKVRQNTHLYLLSLDFITTELSQTELNRFFWLISDDPNLGEEVRHVKRYNGLRLE